VIGLFSSHLENQNNISTNCINEPINNYTNNTILIGIDICTIAIFELYQSSETHQLKMKTALILKQQEQTKSCAKKS